MENLTSFYDQSLKDHGDAIESVAWGSRESQEKRFQILCEIADLEGKSVLDVGCGLADFYAWLATRFSGVRYTGIDVTPAMVEFASSKYPQVEFRTQNILDLDPSEPTHDYVFASGIFNRKAPRHESFVKDSIRRMFAVSRMGTAFNFLSTKADFMNGEEYYSDPGEVLSFCLTLTRKVVVRHDYMTHDLSVYLYTENQSGING